MATMLDYFNMMVKEQLASSAIDIVSKANVMVNLAIKKAQFIDGGAFVGQPVIKSLPTSKVVAFNGPITFPDNYDENEVEAVYPINFYGINIQFSDPDLARIRGRKAFGNLLKLRFSEGEEAMRQRLGQDFWLDGTNLSQPGIVGMEAYVNDAANYANYAGIDRNDITDWNANVLSHTGNRALSTSLVETLQQDCTIGVERPNIHCTSGPGVTKMAQLIQPIQRAVQGDLGSWGFKNIAFNGYPIIRDDFIPTSPGDLYYEINTRWIQMWFLTGWFFNWIPIQRIAKTNQWCGQIMTGMALVGNNPKTQGVITDLDFSL